ncbi:citrate transporter [Enterocloster clostridioformis]|uniref:citrate transporter n=1 Tax=Enterocloster clostridioformis TaxID=1531 RepID=UPI00080C95B4|nr:citrate transporter [Enterocloster clostridioformis]ANU49996.1 citrate transporter [Lachnoclostridium sp. YL32]NDO28511.1 citrate transporter [Enterocloster clostridioformis]OXE70943.1 citrate transporter [Enterocloster clostridioformis]QQR01097.1 citrate transporter [Enterocloster clostridioformis]
MIESAVVLTPLHYAYLIGVIVILAVMVLKKDTPAVCIAFLFILGLIGLKSVTGGIITVFSAVLYAGREFMEVLATIALVTSLSKCLKDLGSDYLMMVPMAGIMKTPSLTWWILGLTMFLFSLFLWPSPSVALAGAIMLPFAVKAGLNPLAAAMAMNLFGHGFALSYDVVIQGAPAISAGAAGLDASSILRQAWPLFWAMGIVTVLSAYVLNRGQLDARGPRLSIQAEPSGPRGPRKAALFLAAITPLAFAGDIILMLLCGLKGGDATSMVSGTALLLTCLGALLGFGKQSLEKATGYVTEGFLFAIRIFAPVIIIGAFFFLGGEGITSIMGEGFTRGIMNDWALWLAQNAPLNQYMAAFIQMVVGGLTGLDGSGFSGLPLTGALARTFGTATGSSVPVMAALGQITAIFVGGGTIVPWGLIPVAAICNVSPLELARRNLIPVCIGFACTFALACFML